MRKRFSNPKRVAFQACGWNGPPGLAAASRVEWEKCRDRESKVAATSCPRLKRFSAMPDPDPTRPGRLGARVIKLVRAVSLTDTSFTTVVLTPPSKVKCAANPSGAVGAHGQHAPSRVWAESAPDLKQNTVLKNKCRKPASVVVRDFTSTGHLGPFALTNVKEDFLRAAECTLAVLRTNQKRDRAAEHRTTVCGVIGRAASEGTEMKYFAEVDYDIVPVPDIVEMRIWFRTTNATLTDAVTTRHGLNLDLARPLVAADTKSGRSTIATVTWSASTDNFVATR